MTMTSGFGSQPYSRAETIAAIWPARVVSVALSGADYTSIQSANDYAVTQGAAGGTEWAIDVAPGTYTENPSISAGVSVVAVGGPGTVTIIGNVTVAAGGYLDPAISYTGTLTGEQGGLLAPSEIRTTGLDDPRVPGGFSLLPPNVGVLTLRLDDGRSSIATASGICVTYGLPLSLAINPVRQAEAQAGYLTTAELVALADIGHEVVNHGYTHSGLAAGSMESSTLYASEILAAQDWFTANGIDCETYVTAGRTNGGPNTVAEWRNTLWGRGLRRMYSLCVSLAIPPVRAMPLQQRYGIGEALAIEDSSGGTVGRMLTAARWMNHIAGEPCCTHMYWHDTNTGTANISSANLTLLLRHAAMLRAMGRLEIKTFGQLARTLPQVATGRTSIVPNGSFERISPGVASGGGSDLASDGIWRKQGPVPWGFDENADIHGGALQTLVAATTALASDAAQNSTNVVLTDASLFPTPAADKPLMVEIRATAGGVAPPYRICYTGKTVNTLNGCSKHPAFTAATGYTVRLVGHYPTAITTTTLTCTGAFVGLAGDYYVRFLMGPGSGLEPLLATRTDDNILTFAAALSTDSKNVLLMSTTTLFELASTTTLARTGRNYLWLKGGVAGGTTASTFSFYGIPVVPGKSYRISWWQYPLTSGKYLDAQIEGRTDYDLTSGTVITGFAYTNANTRRLSVTQEIWEQHHITIRAPKALDYRNLLIRWRISGGGFGPMLIDDIEVVEI